VLHGKRFLFDIYCTMSRHILPRMRALHLLMFYYGPQSCDIVTLRGFKFVITENYS